MKNLNIEKTDVVSVILDDSDLLDSFADALKLPDEIREEKEEEEFMLMKISSSSIGLLQKAKCYIWKMLKTVMRQLSIKAQVLAVLAEYHSKYEDKKVQAFLTKEK